VIHVDHYGNIATNIPSEMLTHLVPGQWLTLTLAERTHVLPFVETYGAGPRDQPICLINSNDACEIALPHGNAAARLAVQVGDRVVLQPGRAVAYGFFWWHVIDFHFTADQEALRQEIHTFERAALPEPPDIPEDAWIIGFERAFSKKLSARGWIGLTWPRAYGGQGKSYLDRLILT